MKLIGVSAFSDLDRKSIATIVAWLFLGGLLVAGLFLQGQSEDYRKLKETVRTWDSGIVDNISVTYETVAGESGSPVAGAIVGGLIAGTTGAIIGAISESGPAQPPRTQISGCSVVIITVLESKQIAQNYLSPYDQNRERCALLKKGDSLKLIRHEYRERVSFSVLLPG